MTPKLAPTKSIKKVSKKSPWILFYKDFFPYYRIETASFIKEVRDILDVSMYGDKEFYEVAVVDLLNDSDYVNSAEREGSDFLKALVVSAKAEVEKIKKDVTSETSLPFRALKYFFTPDSEVVYDEHEITVGGIVDDVSFDSSWTKVFLVVRIKSIGSNGKQFSSVQHVTIIDEYSGRKSISEFGVRKITPEIKEKLTAKNLSISKYLIGNHFVENSGEMRITMWFGQFFVNAGKKVQIDINGYEAKSAKGRGSSPTSQQSMSEIPDNAIWQIYPWVHGFSYKLKQWGEFDLNKISPYKYNPDSFNKLVLEEEKKTIIKALITHYNSAFSDIVADKSGGCIFLLHGTPGVGKTLTAETVAEYLKRPLYPISVGELGIKADELEKNLSNVLEIVSSWNAVLLLDEADIFLEQRATNDIERNALVSIFLRLLEYHQGIIFLTTNRANDIDKAFHSRITLTIGYKALDNQKRSQIWSTLLNAAKISLSNQEIQLLGNDTQMNGREIKNAIRISQCMAMERKVPLTYNIISESIRIKDDFNQGN
jgi:hypothetical protein